MEGKKEMRKEGGKKGSWDGKKEIKGDRKARGMKKKEPEI